MATLYDYKEITPTGVDPQLIEHNFTIIKWNFKGLISDLASNLPDAGTTAGQMLFWNGTTWTYTETTEMYWDDTDKTLSVGDSSPGLASLYVASTTDRSGTLASLYSLSTADNMTIGNIIGSISSARVLPNVGAVSATNLIGSDIRVSAVGAIGGNADVTNVYGAKISSTISGGGTRTNAYGIYIDAISGATNNYAIYSAGGNSYHAGTLTLGAVAYTNVDGNAGEFLQTNGAGVTTFAVAGDVFGPASATDNAIARFDGTTGKLIQNSAVTVADTTGLITTLSGITNTTSALLLNDDAGQSIHAFASAASGEEPDFRVHGNPTGTLAYWNMGVNDSLKATYPYATYSTDSNGHYFQQRLVLMGGTSTAPSLTFIGGTADGTDGNTGIFRIAENRFGITAGGLVYEFNATYFQSQAGSAYAIKVGSNTSQNTPTYGFSSGAGTQYSGMGFFRKGFAYGETNACAIASGGYVSMLFGNSGDVHMRPDAASGETPAFKWSGYKAGDSGVRTVSQQISSTVNDQAEWSGVSNYSFAGTIKNDAASIAPTTGLITTLSGITNTTSALLLNDDGAQDVIIGSSLGTDDNPNLILYGDRSGTTHNLAIAVQESSNGVDFKQSSGANWWFRSVDTGAYFTMNAGASTTTLKASGSTISFRSDTASTFIFDMKGATSQNARMRVYDQSGTTYGDMQAISNEFWIQTNGSSPGDLTFQRNAHADVTCFEAAASGETPSFKLSGYHASGNLQTLDIYQGNGEVTFDTGAGTTAAVDLKLDCGTEKTLELVEVVYEDLQVSISNIRIPASSAPTERLYDHGIGGGVTFPVLGFDVGDYLYFDVQTTHAMKLNTVLDNHLHFILPNTTDIGDRFQFQLDVIAAGIETQWAVPTGSPFSSERQVAANDNSYHRLMEIADIPSSNDTVSTIYSCKLTRIAATTDEYGSEVYVKFLDCHYQKNTMGSRQEGSK